MYSESIPKILEQFDCNRRLYSDFSNQLEHLISSLIKTSGLNVYSITSRIKARKSLDKKIRKPNKDYQDINDLTDIVGLRVITYFEDDVDLIADLIRAEFKIDSLNSIDKRKIKETDKFGYISLHYVISINDVRLGLQEYRKFKNLKAEIQIRTILQHAWAEIEHDLGYKSPISIPKDIKRNFYQLAGLLEIADREFKTIRTLLEEHKQEITTELDSFNYFINIDKDSLDMFIKTDSLVLEVDNLISAATQIEINYNQTSTNLILDTISSISSIQLTTIKELYDKLLAYKHEVVSFAKTILKVNPNASYNYGFSLYILILVLSISDNKKGGYSK